MNILVGLLQSVDQTLKSGKMPHHFENPHNAHYPHQAHYLPGLADDLKKKMKSFVIISGLSQFVNQGYDQTKNTE